MDDERLESGGKKNPITLEDRNEPFLFVETSALTEEGIPRDAISVCSETSSAQYWREEARYILYEEIYDAESGTFDNPQCPTVPYHILDRLISIFQKDLEIMQSDAWMYVDLVPEITAYLKKKDYLSSSRYIKLLESTLLAHRWHPEVLAGGRQLSVFRRRTSRTHKSSGAVELVNKTLSKSLPKNCEACSIMTGYLPYLKKNLYLLVQLTTEPAPKMPGLVEVDVGTRFIFLAFTPSMNEDFSLLQLSRCFASMLGEQNFLQSMYQAQNSSDLYKSALRFRKCLNVISIRYRHMLSKTGGIDVPRENLTEVNFDQSDLVFNSHVDDLEVDEFTDAEATLHEEQLLHCSLISCKRLFPPFRDLWKGFKMLLMRMPGDYTDAFTKENFGTVLSSILFIYFVVFGPAITFGTLMLEQVNSSFNISLNIFAIGVFSVVFALFGGQPLGSIGPSGVGFIFETVVAYFAELIDADYQIYRFWTGVYMAVFGVILIALNLSNMVIYARRSLEEIFSGFISLFLILKALLSMFRAVPQNISQAEDMIVASRAAIQLFLALCMLSFCLFINHVKRSHFFRRQIRYWLGALNVPLGIVFVSLLSYIFFSSYPVAKLSVPSASEAVPSEWFHVVNFSSVTTFQTPSPALLHGMALLIGFFFSLLTFTETALNSVTALKPKAKKPSPFVMDHILTVVIFPLMSCILGWPFVSGVPVRTIANTMALIKVDPHPPPGKPAEIICLVEQRVSVLIAGILVVVSVYLGDILHLIPVGALYGMFIFLGLNGLRGLDSVNTVLALLTRRKYWGRWDFLTNLPVPQLAVIVTINFAELGILIVFIFLAEFTNLGFVSLVTPLIFIFSGVLREFVLPKWNWLAPCLAKYDKRCLPLPDQDTQTSTKLSESTSYAESDRISLDGKPTF
ncbi:hypothetical protein Aperf_G00000072371 [Anoplocephala perfoliata]